MVALKFLGLFSLVFSLKYAGVYFNITESQVVNTTLDSHWHVYFLSARNGHDYFVVSQNMRMADAASAVISVLDINDGVYNAVGTGPVLNYTWSNTTYDTQVEDLRMFSSSPDLVSSLTSISTFSNVTFNLTSVPKGPNLYDGGSGTFLWSTGPTLEWGATECWTTGTITYKGEEIEVIPEKSVSWYDRQWGAGVAPQGWNWFGIYIDNGVQISVWHTNNPPSNAAFSYSQMFATILYTDGHHEIYPIDQDIQPTDPFVSPVTNITYYGKYRISIPLKETVLDVTLPVHVGEMVDPEYPTFALFEAFSTVNGIFDGQQEFILFQYAQATVQEQNDPNLQTGLGEPKFNLDNSVFTGPWGRPQNDSPATRAITLMNFANTYMSFGGSTSTVVSKIWDLNAYPSSAPVLRNLLYVANNWANPSFDLWEEEESDHFYTRMVQRRALIMGSQFAQQLGYSSVSQTVSSAANSLSQTISQLRDPVRNLILYEYGPVLHGKTSFKDAAVLLDVLHGYTNDNVYSYTSDEALASAFELATSFIGIYPIAGTTVDSSGLPLGIPIGRYPEDTYNGVDTTSQGNPWFLCTTTLAELFYRAAYKYTTQDQQITVTNASLPFWNYFAPQVIYTAGTTYNMQDAHFTQMIASLTGWGDAFMRRVKYHAGTSGHLTEEYRRDTGYETGAADLIWSYAAILTAAFARAQLLGSGSYVATLATA
ncbi:hypothetical protein BZG36_03383 [Bifiguratus adelaidae]|uniref:glucan 1,4-alpha-glucosidase n=1 Tax=Bifiguratus adelaidae TaxID=1938954 RepID=A0A261Y0G7_9FUNG|nr:hypothetical protein BZG36_03383 [Bifiguratus adelaidae]